MTKKIHKKLKSNHRWDSYLVKSEAYLASCGSSGGGFFDLTDEINWGNLGAAKREGIGGVISIPDSRCWIRELENWLNEKVWRVVINILVGGDGYK